MANVKLIRVGKPLTALQTMTATNRAMDASTDQIEYIFEALDSITCTKLGIRLGTITGVTPTYKISLQGVDGSGNPDGTILGGGTPASKTFSPTTLAWAAGSWNWLTLDNSIALTRGTVYAIVVAYDSGTIDASNNASFTTIYNGTERFPYAINNNAGVRARENGLPIFGYASSTKAYGRPTLSHAIVTINSTGSPDEVAMKFTLPAGMGDTYQIIGIRGTLVFTAASSNKIVLYGGTDATAANSTGAVTEMTVFQDVTLDSDLASINTTGDFEIYFDEATLTTLYFGATYRLALQPQTAVNTSALSHTVTTASDFDAYANEQDFAYSERTNLGNWTDDTARRLFIDLIVADITEPAGAAGGGPLIGGRLTR